MNTKKQAVAMWLSAVVGFATPAYFAWQTYTKQWGLNLATWALIFILDALGLVLAYKSGNKRPWIQWGWAVAASLILLATLNNKHTWAFGWVEYICIACCFISVYFWLTEKADRGLMSYIVAVYISFVPQLVDYWDSPQPETWWLWLGSIVACACAIYGAEKKDFVHTFVPWACIPFNLLGYFLVTR